MATCISVFLVVLSLFSINKSFDNLLCNKSIWRYDYVGARPSCPSKPYLNHTECELIAHYDPAGECEKPYIYDAASIFSNPNNYPISFTIIGIANSHNPNQTGDLGIWFKMTDDNQDTNGIAVQSYLNPMQLRFEFQHPNSTQYRFHVKYFIPNGNNWYSRYFTFDSEASKIIHIGILVLQNTADTFTISSAYWKYNNKTLNPTSIPTISPSNDEELDDQSGDVFSVTAWIVIIVLIGVICVCCVIVSGLYFDMKQRGKDKTKNELNQTFVSVNERKDLLTRFGSNLQDETDAEIHLIFSALSESKLNELYGIYQTSKMTCFNELDQMGLSDRFIEKLFQEFDSRAKETNTQ